MKIAIPTEGKKGLDEVVSEHFGKCDTYTFLNEEGKVSEIIDNTSEHMGGFGLPPELLKKHGVDVLLCRGLGPRAIDLCRTLGIEVYVGRAVKVKDIFREWKENKAKKAGLNDGCEHHGHNC